MERVARSKESDEERDDRALEKSCCGFGPGLTIFIINEFLDERHVGTSTGPIRSSPKNNGQGWVGTLMWKKISGEQWKSLSSILVGL